MHNKTMKKVILLSASLLLICGVFAVQSLGVKKSAIDNAVALKQSLASSSPVGFPYVSKTFKRGDAAGAVNVDLAGLKELVLVTDPTADGNSSDHALWADAFLIKKDGSKVALDKAPMKYKQVSNNWYTVGKNFEGSKLSIGVVKYEGGVIAHTPSIIVLDLAGGDFVRFQSSIGIDNGAGAPASAVFKVMANSGIEQASALVAQNPELKAELLPYISVSLESWLTTPGVDAEKAALNSILAKVNKKGYFDGEIARLNAITDYPAQVKGYLELIAKAQNVARLQEELSWLNPTAVGKAFDEFCTHKNYERAKWQPKYDEFKTMVAANNGFDGIYSYEPNAVSALDRAIILKKEIMLSNPSIDFDKILVTRYRLGENARQVDAGQLGTQPNNWSSQLSASREKRDAEIITLSDLTNANPTQSVVYKPAKGEAIADVMLHWNADKMLFTSQDDFRRWQVYEVGADGKNLRQITNAPESDMEFFDASYLPSGKMIVNTNMGYHGVPCVNGEDAIGNFALLDPATGDMRRICFDQENNWHPTVMNNGKVMYTRWEYTDLMHYYSRIVFHMNPDGTEQKALYGSGSYFPNSTFDMQPLPGHATAFVGIISGHHGVVRAGRLMIFNPEMSRKEEKAIVQEIPYSTRPVVPLVKDELVNGVWPQFIKPQPIDDKYFLVTAKLTPDDLWGVYLVDIYDNVTLIAKTEGEGFINPIPFRKRETPPVIPERVDLSKDDATVFIQDIYEGEGLPGVPRGTVKKLRVLSYEFAYIKTLSDHLAQGIQSGWDIKRELGTVDVEPDGSAIFTVPANTPIALQPLDEQGRAIQLMRSWFTGMPGETVSCVGCHEDQNMIAIPKRVSASQKSPQAIEPPKGGIRPFTFALEVQPILDRNCIACHNGQGSTPLNFRSDAGLDSIGDWAGKRYFAKNYLAFHPYFYRQGPEAEMYVLNPYEYATMSSEMFQILENNHHGVKLADNEMRTLYQWLDFNVPFNGTFKANPLKDLTGVTYDQFKRRREISQKYASVDVDWQKELVDYTEKLKSQGEITPVMPANIPEPAKDVKVKGWPFDAAKAKSMQSGYEDKIVDLGGGVTMKFVYIPAGTYVAGGDGLGQTKPYQKVAIKKGFYMSATELTNEQMRALIPQHNSRYVGQFWKDHTTPGYNVDSAQFAASKVSYERAAEFVQKLAQKTGLKVAIPTEEQWEWAARAGSDKDFWFGTRNDDFSKYDNLSDQNMTQMAVSGIDPVPMSHNNPWYPYLNYVPKQDAVNDGNMLLTTPAQYEANPWGLYDINGNVAEWTCTDFERSSAPSIVAADKVVKGGSWYERPSRATVAIRRNYLPWQAPFNVGVRLIIEQ